MNTIYLIAFEITVILIIIYTLPVNIAVFTTFVIIGSVFIISRKKQLVLLILPFAFLIRGITSIDFIDYSIENTVTVNGRFYSEFGKIEKINNRYPSVPTFVKTEEIEDGKHSITGNITRTNKKYGNNYLYIKNLKTEKIEENRIKKYFSDKSKKLLTNTDSQLKKLYKAVVLGENYRLPKKLKEKFSYIGISHLMALSGFHIGLVILIADWIFSKFPLKKQNKNILLIIFITIYYLGIEHSPSLTRAYIMGVIYLSGNILYENTDLMKSLAVAYTLSLFINPADINTVSFKLSYGAVFIIAGIYPLIKNRFNLKNSKFKESILLVMTIQIFLAPVLINEFGTIQILGFISNIALVPLGTVFITLSFTGLLLENIALGFIIKPLIKISYLIFIKGVNIFSTIPFMSINISTGYGNRIFYFCYFGILLIIIYLCKKKEKTTDEKLYRRTHISQ